MISIRYGIQRHFLKIRHVDVVNNDIFKPPNLIFQAMLVKLKQISKGTSVHKPPIEVDDLALLFNSFNMDTPADLQNKAFVDFILYFCNRGRENLREMKKQDFQFHGNGDNRHLTLRDHYTKNHRGESNGDAESQGGRLYVVPANPLCPVKSFEQYLSVLNPDCDCFWQRPKTVVNKTVNVWFDNAPVGKNTLGDKMKNLSQKATVSKGYTNYCLRATTITLLDDVGFEARHIMSISGHKSETSIRSNSRTGEAQKRKIAKTLCDKLIGHIPAKHGNNDNSSTNITKDIRSISDQNVEQKSSNVGDIDLNDMDLLELTSSQEHLFLESIADNVPNDQTRTVINATRHVEHTRSRVLTDRTNLHLPNNMVFHNVQELHIH